MWCPYCFLNGIVINRVQVLENQLFESVQLDYLGLRYLSLFEYGLNAVLSLRQGGVVVFFFEGANHRLHHNPRHLLIRSLICPSHNLQLNLWSDSSLTDS